MAQLILQHGRPAAVVGSNRIFLAPHIAALPLAHPVRREVVAKAVYALDVAAGVRSGPYSDDAAERWAKRLIGGLCADGRRRRWGMPLS